MPALNTKTDVQEWGDKLNIPAEIREEVRTYSDLGWAIDSNYKATQLSIPQMKMVALACYRTGLSLLGKQIIFLGNSLYCTKPGKVAVARKDKLMPLVEVVTRPATADERAACGLVHNNSDDTKKFEHLWCCELYATVQVGVRAEVRRVSNGFGHACCGNINLKGKDFDTHRLCQDMAETRAFSRAAAKVYDFFGLESFEEVELGRPEINGRKIIDAEATVLTPTDTVEVTPESVVAYLADAVNKGLVEAALIQKFSLERLKTYKAEALNDAWKIIKERVESAAAKAKPEDGAGQEESGPAETKDQFPGDRPTA